MFLPAIPPEILTALVAATPIAEVRIAVPFALHQLGLVPITTYVFAFAGNIIPIFSIVVMGAVSDWLSRHIYWFNRFFAWLFERTRKNHHNKVSRWGVFALLILVAIPLPFTGVWTASLVSFVFGIPFLRAFPFITAGSAIATFLMLLISLGLIPLFL